MNIESTGAAIKKSKMDVIEAREHEIDIVMDRRMESSPEPSEMCRFLAMFDDCLEAIFSWLPLADLCSLSLTCKRAFKLTNEYFHRKYPHHGMEISNELCGPTIKFNENYVKCFRSNIQNIRLTSVYWNLNVHHLFTFLRLNCCENLRELEFDTINLKSKKPYGAQIHAQLINLTTVSIINCAIHDIYSAILQYCQHLKHLCVREEKPIDMNYQWMQKTYPHLESLIYYVSESESHNIRINTDNPLTQFFERNPHIQKVASDHRVVHIISQANINLKYLVVCIEHAALFSLIYSELKVMCEQRRVQRLRLVFGWYMTFCQVMTNLLASLGTFVTLDLSFDIKESQFISFHPIRCQLFPNVKSLSLEFSHPILETDPIILALPITVPNIEEVHLNPWCKEFIVNLWSCIGIFAKEFKHLHTLVVRSIDPDIIPPDAVVKMNVCRKGISGACLLTIYFPYEVIQKIKFIMPVDSSLVNVKPISSLKRDIFTSDRRFIWFRDINRTR